MEYMNILINTKLPIIDLLYHFYAEQHKKAMSAQSLKKIPA